MSIENEVRSSWHDTIVELFELDLSVITEDAEDVFYFTKDIFPDGRKLQWQGNTYEPFPIEITGFETTTRGSVPQPELTAANVLGTLASAVGSFDDLVGAKVTRRRTLGKYLDNGTSPNPLEEFPPDIYYIERKTSESSLSISWQLASKIDLEGLQLPRRVITQNYCIWKYRGEECGYTGPPVADERDRPLVADNSAQSQAYIAALRAFEAARTAQRSAQFKVSTAISRETTDCNPATRPIAITYSNIVPPELSFGLASNGQPLFGAVSDIAVTLDGDDPDYRLSRSIRTGFGPELNSTGAVHQVDLWSGNTISQSFYSTTKPVSFAFKLSDTSASYTAIVNGQIVPLVSSGAGYRLGPQRAMDVATVTAVGLVDKNDLRCSEAQSALAAAEAELAAANATLEAASDALDAAADALPSNSALLRQDVCGKRLNSCKLRFGRTELPFGGFPGANITR